VADEDSQGVVTAQEIQIKAEFGEGGDRLDLLVDLADLGFKLAALVVEVVDPVAELRQLGVEFLAVDDPGLAGVVVLDPERAFERPNGDELLVGFLRAFQRAAAVEALPGAVVVRQIQQVQCVDSSMTSSMTRFEPCHPTPCSSAQV